MQQIIFPVRVLKFLGIRYLFLSNASGGVNPDFEVGDLMIITDHINLLPNPLIGKHIPEFGPRFPDMGKTYSDQLIRMAESIAGENRFSVRLKEGGVILIAASGGFEAWNSKVEPEDEGNPATSVFLREALVSDVIARTHGIESGSLVRVTTANGELTCTARIDSSLRDDVVVIPEGSWEMSGGAVNRLTSDDLSDEGECATYNDAACNLSRVV